MRRLSSKTTFLQKRLFPALWFGGLLLFLVSAASGRLRLGQFPPLPVLIVPILMAGFGYFMFRKLTFGLVDEVWDDGDTLIVRNGNEEERIALSEIMNVSYSLYPNPTRVTLSLRGTTRFGREISFYPPARAWPFSRSPIVDELIERIDAKRRA